MPINDKKVLSEKASKNSPAMSVNKSQNEEINIHDEDQQKENKSEDDFESFVLKELQDMRENMEELKGENQGLASKVDYLEEVIDQKDKRISHLTDLMNNLTNQLKDLIQYENSVLKQNISKDIKTKFDELEKTLDKKNQMPITGPILASSTGQLNGSHILSSGKSKLTDQSLRNKQADLVELMKKLKEKIALRDVKLNQLKSYSNENFNDF